MRILVNQRPVRGAALLAVVLLFILAGCGARTPAGPAFDIPSLIGKKLPALEKQLGSVRTQSDNGDTGIAEFESGDYRLRVEYLRRSGRVTSLALVFADTAQSVSEDNKALLLQAGALREDDSRYSVEGIEHPEKALSLSGLRVTPAPVRHNVELRVKSTSMVTVRYNAPAGSQGSTRPGESFMTIPPWSLPFEATTGTTVGIEAGPSTLAPPSGAGYETTTVQIIVDGKLAGQFTSNGGTAHCELELD